MPEPVIVVDSLVKSFGRHLVLNRISLRIKSGERFGLVGLNGAGKTTLIRLLLGVLRPDAGTITISGVNPWSHDAALFRGMGVVLEHDGFLGNLTFAQNMDIFGRAKGLTSQETTSYIERFWSDSPLYKNPKPVKFFSRGQRVQCALARAFLGNPSVFLFDEPAVALDMDAYEHFKHLVREFSGKGATFLISSHQLDTIDDLCDRVGILRDQRLGEMDRQHRGMGERWELETDAHAAWGALIAEVCGNEPSWKSGVWEFTIAERTMVPALVKRLVEAGCAITRIAPAADSFSDAIREEYRRRGVGNAEENTL